MTKLPNRLKLLKEVDYRDKESRKLGLFSCQCGNEKVLSISRVLSNSIRSCGCMVKDTRVNKTHGMRYTRTYSCWSGAKARATCKLNKDYPRYGGIGIGMSDEWVNSFESFYSDMGECPENKTLDRKDTTLGYSKENCKWSTVTEQQRNRLNSAIWHIKGINFESAEHAAVHFNVSRTSVTRWVHGYFDSRRNTFTKPKEDCYKEMKYGSA